MLNTGQDCMVQDIHLHPVTDVKHTEHVCTLSTRVDHWTNLHAIYI